MCEVEFGDVNQPPLRPALGMRSSGQALAIKLVDRVLWNLPPKVCYGYILFRALWNLPTKVCYGYLDIFGTFHPRLAI